MTDETFRQQRKKAEVETGENEAQQVQQTLETVQSIRQQADAPDGPGPAGQAGMAIEGNPHPAFLEALKKQESMPEPQRQQQAMPAFSNAAPQRVGNEDFNTLLHGLRQTTQIYEEIKLPSMGRFYSGKDGPETGILHIRPMTGEEEQILATQRFVRRGSAMNMIFKNCIRESIEPDKLLTIDRTFLLIYLRGISYTTAYEVQIKCQECSANFNYTIDLDALPIRWCPPSFDESYLSDELPTSKYKFTYRLPIGLDENVISEYRERKNRGFGSEAVDDSLLYRMSMLVTSISNGDVSVNDSGAILALLKRFPINDVSYIRSVVDNPPFGIDTDVPVVCPLCDADFDVDLPIEASFFFPRIRREKNS